ncbi:hypothetical protein X777_14616 [Ooceraea biroi]|uniref:Uncharacterized protein n=1 Tax=Ooceraea biroi TaxID=2015173 RepID=A0A026WWZ0_OOCBI|nr:hypothetical protein X777_14616 [Ooceraea biroi]
MEEGRVKHEEEGIAVRRQAKGTLCMRAKGKEGWGMERKGATGGLAAAVTSSFNE